MAEITMKSRKKKWKGVAIDNPAFFSGSMDGFVCLEELVEYDLESVAGGSSRAGNEKSDKKTVTGMENKAKKKKRKKKRKQGEQTDADKSQDGSDSKPEIAEGKDEDTRNKTRATKKEKKKSKVEMTETKNEDESQNKTRGKNKNQEGTPEIADPKDDNTSQNETRGKKKGEKRTREMAETKNEDTNQIGPQRKKKKPTNKRKIPEAKDEDTSQNETQGEKKENEGRIHNMSEWNGLGVPDDVLKALSEQGFTTPTSIQALAIPPAIFHHRDIIGAAETGSGKTLAFGIPIIHHIMALKEHSPANNTSTDNEDEPEDGEDDANKNPLLALIMTPTRELALQIRDHLIAAAKYTSIDVAAVVGGMATQKQQRLLKKHPEIVVATPGRLWEMITMQEGHVSDFGQLRYLVIDEADRMIEQGHFEELSSILDAIHFQKSTKSFDSCYPEEDMKVNKEKRQTTKLQKFIFSATLTFPKSIKKKGQNYVLSTEEMLGRLMNKMNMDHKKAKIINVTTKKGTAQTLTEARITCSKEDKDAYLYYFLLKYPGRTLVFTNTIDCIRRLASILRLLQLNPLPLHANMQQRQRLKNLDRFKSSGNGLLVSTDVAARGLDIPKVQHVIHYQVPKDPEVYIHRSGRTARALNEGLSVVLVGPEDLASYRKIMKSLNNGNDLDSFPIETPYLTDVRSRMSLARNIDKEQNKIQKKKSSNDWFVASAKAMDIEVDDDLLEDLGDSREKKLQQRKIDQMKASLSSMIKKPLVPKGFSGKYPTKSGKLVVPGFQDGFPDTKVLPKTAVDEVKKKKRRLR